MLYRLETVAQFSRKMAQFQLALRCGFVVPASLWSVGHNHALEFANMFPSSVCKPISTRDYPSRAASSGSKNILMTFGVTEELVKNSDSLEFDTCSVFLQERLGSGYEYRVIAFRSEIFCYKYIVPVEDRLFPDERILYGGNVNGKNVYGAMFEYIVDPPSFLLPALSKFLTEAGLMYGAFDLIIGTDNQVYFLECNPEGQWFSAYATDTMHLVINAMVDEVTRTLAAEGAPK